MKKPNPPTTSNGNGQRLKLTHRTVVTGGVFLPAFDRLSEQASLSVKDRYALARSRRDIAAAIETCEKLRIDLVKKIGVPEAEIRKRQLAELKSSNKESRKAGNSDASDAQIKAFEQRIKLAEESDSYMVDDEDKEATENFKKEFEQLMDIEFEIFLDHKIPLADPCTLSGKDIALLLDVIAEPS